jgi:hypothetical protein
MNAEPMADMRGIFEGISRFCVTLLIGVWRKAWLLGFSPLFFNKERIAMAESIKANEKNRSHHLSLNIDFCRLTRGNCGDWHFSLFCSMRDALSIREEMASSTKLTSY